MFSGSIYLELLKGERDECSYLLRVSCVLLTVASVAVSSIKDSTSLSKQDFYRKTHQPALIQKSDLVRECVPREINFSRHGFALVELILLDDTVY